MSNSLFKFQLRARYSYFNVFNMSIRDNSVWTSEKVAKSPYKDVDIPKMTIDQYTWRNLDEWLKKTAVMCSVSKRAYTYEEVYNKSRIFGASLRKKLKVKDGDTVTVVLPNVPEYPIVVHGILAAGGVASTLNPIYTSYEIQKLLLLSESSVIITVGEIVARVKDVLIQIKKDLPIISMDVDQALPQGTMSYKELVDVDHMDLSVLNEVQRSHEDTALLLFSSGTTGLPKAVQLTNFNVVANCEQHNAACRRYAYTTETNQDTVLAVLPLFHIYGLCVIMLYKMSAGLKIVTLPKFQPDTFLNSLLNDKIRLLYIVPPMVSFLGTHPGVTSKHLEHLTCVTSGAAPLPSAEIQRFLERAPREVQFDHAYGLTETSPLIAITPKDRMINKDVGYVLPNIDIRIVDKDMRNLGPGEVGEILLRGPNIMKGYLKNPEANNEVFVDGDWLRTGDIGKIDDTGLLTITDRIKDIIKVKGYQVPPSELESVLMEHPCILDAAVVGISDPYTGERPTAFVVLKKGADASAENIISFVNDKVASYKKIKDVSFLDAIPKNPTGKILRKLIKEKYC